MTTSPSYNGPAWTAEAIHPGYNRFSTEWYKLFVAVAQAALPNGPGSDTVADAETLSLLQNAATDFGQLPQLAKQVTQAAELAYLGPIIDPSSVQALRRGLDAEVLAEALGQVSDALVERALRRALDAQVLSLWLAPALATATAGSALLGLGGGTTANRPANPPLYGYYFDTTLGIPIFCEAVTPSVTWVNAAGVVV